MIDIAVRPFTLKEARKSAWVVATVFALLAGWQVYRQHDFLARVFGIAAVALVVISAVPPAARVFHTSWMTLAGVLGYINSRILLGLLYYGVVTPIGIVARLSGHDPLHRRAVKGTSYWHRRERSRQTREGFERAH